MSELDLAPITNVLVPGRALLQHPDGSLGLSPSSVNRVLTAASYFAEHRGAFEEQGGRIHFEGGWAEAAAGMPKPPEEYREGRLMNNLAADIGIPARFRSEGIESTTTMDNCLRARRYFATAARLLIDTQVSQAPRLLYCAGKVFPDTELTILEAPGETTPDDIATEASLLRQSRLLYGWARSPRALHVADRTGVMLGRLAGLRPAAKYGTAY